MRERQPEGLKQKPGSRTREPGFRDRRFQPLTHLSNYAALELTASGSPLVVALLAARLP